MLRSRHKFELAQQAIELFEKFTNPRSLVSLTGLKSRPATRSNSAEAGRDHLRAREIRVKAAELALSIQNEAMKTIERTLPPARSSPPARRSGLRRAAVLALRRTDRCGHRVGIRIRSLQFARPGKPCRWLSPFTSRLVRTLSEGQAATISLEALPDLALRGSGQVDQSAASSRNFPNYDLRENEVIVELLAEPEP